MKICRRPTEYFGGNLCLNIGLVHTSELDRSQTDPWQSDFNVNARMRTEIDLNESTSLIRMFNQKSEKQSTLNT